MADNDLVTGPDGGQLSHDQYCRRMQQRLAEAAQAGMSRIEIAPLRVAAFTAWCTTNKREPGPDARGAYAADLARRRDPSVVGWPPGRNQRCWCGSGRKYKKCCAAPPAT